MAIVDSARRRHPTGWQWFGGVLRASLVVAVTFSFYAFAPLGQRPEGAVAVQLVLWMLVFIAVIAWQVHAVINSSFPGLRAIEAVVVSLPVFILLFAAAYFVTGQLDPANFSEPLNRVDALYFSVTIFSTVGFGDITPRSDPARMMVTAQMIADLVLIGFIAKVLFGAVELRRKALNLGPPHVGKTDPDKND
jgi:voltage-gated potassium channel